MFNAASKRNHSFRALRALASIALLLTFVCAGQSRSAGASDTGAPEPATAPLSPAIVGLLPDTLAGVEANGSLKQVANDGLFSALANKTAVSREYLVESGASRQYASARVEIYETRHPFAAFGLFNFYTRGGESDAVEDQ